MAHDGGFGNIIILGGLAVGGYYLWQWWSAQQEQAAAAATVARSGSSTPPTPPAYVYTPPTILQQLQTEAATNTIIQAQGGQADAYQWATLYNSVTPTPPTSPSVNNIFFPNGLPANPTPNAPGMSQSGLPLMTAQTFLQGLQANNINVGLSGLGQAPKLISVPVMLAKQKRNIRVPAGTTPAQLQARLKSYQKTGVA